MSEIQQTARGIENGANGKHDAPLLSVRNLSIGFPDRSGNVQSVVRDIGFELRAGESLAVVGESGSGKTLIGKALLGLLPDAARVMQGNIAFSGRELLAQTPAQWREVRGTGIGMVFQEPMVSLNPAFRVGEQLTEALIRRRGVAPAKAWAQAVAMLERVRVRDPEGCMQRFPHEFSGGMRQRLILAAVMLLRPQLLIADEPTTALDCVVQKEVLDVMTELTREEGTSLIFISHNLALVAAYTQNVLVMRRGDAVETGPVARVLSRPDHDYTLNLLDALPRRENGRKDGEAVHGKGAAPVLEVREVAVDYSRKRGWFGNERVRAVHPMSFTLQAGETLAIVGESGSGKTSITNAVIGLVGTAQGEVLLNGAPFLNAGSKRLREARRAIQVVFQDPYSSLDPRMKVAAIVREGLRPDATLTAAQRRTRVEAALADVGLAGYDDRLVHELSGGQRQRVAIARALVSRPAVIIADEPVSALDVTVQKQVLDMLTALQARYGFACLIISHDLGVVEQVADRVIVMYRGHVVEEGSRDEVFDTPSHPYTQRLLQAVPELRGTREHGFAVQLREVPPLAAPAAHYFDPDLREQHGPASLQHCATARATHRVAMWAQR
ncbi:glutathione ABC transporter ATP binding subunit GsiA [Paraburkholderia unamae]|uniref:dipeptide ABC transporter ATP-binding protein n=1 Tax=Paraburkholderia unamae TaxID=219649 RepID=UPI001CB2509E|nr:ABC transporter ATP-binding protein [Paraburkholderia unamae]CAG9269967.1 glutathione ABC transporter ATP binding subunit GsiA [Paraburkholderia unamae]